VNGRITKWRVLKATLAMSSTGQLVDENKKER